jgi:hypothetical protein
MLCNNRSSFSNNSFVTGDYLKLNPTPKFKVPETSNKKMEERILTYRKRSQAVVVMVVMMKKQRPNEICI